MFYSLALIFKFLLIFNEFELLFSFIFIVDFSGITIDESLLLLFFHYLNFLTPPKIGSLKIKTSMIIIIKTL